MMHFPFIADMNKRIPWWRSGSVLILVSLAGSGCLKSNAPEKVTEATSESALAFQPAPDPEDMTAVWDETEETGVAEGDVRFTSTEKTLPANINPSPALSEMIRFAESGVDESVMLAYVTNSANAFNLGADEIIYLNDIGVPSPVITAMLQHDVALKKTTSTSGLATEISIGTKVTEPIPPPSEAPAPEYVAVPGPTPMDYPVEEAAPVPPQEYDDQSAGFYDALAPYGTWVDVGGYGRCWQPAVAMGNPGWRPYFDRGRWLSTDCGWYWLSDYSWGWAPFHYGRWFRHSQLGWCWTPDAVWGPSWVAWRYSNEYCGWAPLPPRARFRPGFGFTFNGRAVAVNFNFGLGPASFAFIPFQHFHDSHLSRFGLAQDQVARAFGTTVGSTRIVTDHNRVVNNGLAPDHVAAVTHREIRPAIVREMSNGIASVSGTRAERLDPEGRTLTVYRPHSRPQVRIPASVSEPPGQSINQANNNPVPSPARDLARNPGPRVFADSTSQAFPAREIRLSGSDAPLPATPVLPTHSVTETRPAMPLPNLPERPQRTPGVRGSNEPKRPESTPERIRPHSLIVIGKKEPAAHEVLNRAVAAPPQTVLPAPTQAPTENPAPTPRAQNPERVAPPAQFTLPRVAVTPEPRWERPAPAAVERGGSENRAVAIHPEQRVMPAEAPRHIEASVPVHEQVRSAPVESRPARETPTPAAPPAATRDSGDRGSQRR